MLHLTAKQILSDTHDGQDSAQAKAESVGAQFIAPWTP